jgi:hypothetical protein
MNNLYSLDCVFYRESFGSINELIDDVVSSGMDPNYEITKNGVKTGECVIDLIQF